MNKNFKEKQRENILIKLVSKYEEQIKDKQKEIDKLNDKFNTKKNGIAEIKLSKTYWLCLIFLSLIIFPVLGSIIVNGAVGLIISSLSIITVGTALLLCKGIEWKVSKDLAKLNNNIDKREKETEEYVKDLDVLKKHITPAHIEYNIKQNNIDEINNEQDNCFIENINKENEAKEVEGPTLIKRKKRRKV